MFSVARRTVLYRFCLVVMLLLLVLPGLTPVSMPGRIASADPTIPRSYAEFIDGAYLGALGRYPNCFEAQMNTTRWCMPRQWVPYIRKRNASSVRCL